MRRGEAKDHVAQLVLGAENLEDRAIDDAGNQAETQAIGQGRDTKLVGGDGG